MTLPPNEPPALAAIRRGRVLPILRLRDHGRAVEIAEILVATGMRALEITLGDAVAHQSIAAVVKAVVPLPGAYTSTEVLIARTAGAPAGNTIDEVPAWLEAGAIAVGLGSDLVPSSGSLDGLQEHAGRAVRIAGRL